MRLVRRTKALIVATTILVGVLASRAGGQVESCRLTEVFRSSSVQSFNAVTAVSPNDVWTTGEAATPTLAHWDGATWSTMEAGTPSRGRYDLRAIDGARFNAVWAVGVHHSRRSQALILKWDGTTWARVSIPSPERDSALTDVVALDDGTAYAVGGYRTSWGRVRGFVVRFDGAAWKREWVPKGFALTDVSAVTADSIWAIAGDRPFVMHRDGGRWKKVYLPRRNAALRDVAVTPEFAVWFVGDDRRGKPIVLRYEGGNWRTVSVPGQPHQEVLWSVAARSDTDVWVAGLRVGGARANPYAARSTPTGFEYVPAESPRPLAFWDVALDALGGVWTVGATASGGIVERGCI